MKTKNLTLLIILGLVVILGFWGCNGYNNMIKLDENTKGKWGNVQTQYQRRSDLIPALVNTVKGAANFEQNTLTKVMEARANATKVQVNASDLTPEKIQEFQQAQSQVSSSLSRLLVTIERYPELKANQNFQSLQAQLEGTENRIAVARNDFNIAVQEFNSSIRRFPNTVFAGMFGFKSKGYFEAEAAASKPVEVNFDDLKK